MPLIILTGIPSSGKTTRTLELKKYFEDQGKEVIILSEQDEIEKASFDKNMFFKDSQKEKQIRGTLKSDVMRYIGPNNLVILDAGNYIKGYRYEIYCASKANKCTQCTIHCLININEAYGLNEKRSKEEEKYTKEVFDALCMRYEYPVAKNRWDSPLFEVQPEHKLDFQAISECLFQKMAPAPNMATQNAPLSDTNFLYELDKITNEISQLLISAKKTRTMGSFCVPGYQHLIIDLSNVSISQVNILRRQYIIYSKMHTPDVKNIPKLYIQYLKTNFSS